MKKENDRGPRRFSCRIFPEVEKMIIFALFKTYTLWNSKEPFTK